MMRRAPFIAAALALATASTATAQANLRAAPSTRATAEVVLTVPGPMGGDAAPKVIRIDHGQPHLRGRTLHVDSLVPYDQPWRLGANAATTLHTDVDLTVGGMDLSPGTYVLEAIPGRTAWVLTVARITGTDAEGNNVLAEAVKVPLRHRTLSVPLESLSMWLIPSREPGPAAGVLRFAWGTDELSADWVVR